METARKQPMQLYEKLDYLKMIRTNYNDLLYRLNNKEYLESIPKVDLSVKGLKINNSKNKDMYTEEEKNRNVSKNVEYNTRSIY